MGNHICHGSGRVILWDGSISKPAASVSVGELMLEHPQQMVVEFQSLTNGSKPKPLPADMKLESHKDYMMLPMAWRSSTYNKAILFKEEARHVAYYTGFFPLLARICCRVKKEKQPAVVAGSVLFRETLAPPDFNLSRQLSGKTYWKPCLDTIKEKGNVKPKTRFHCLL